MTAVLQPPLGELYELLRADGFTIGVDDHVRIGRLLARDVRWTAETLRISIAALVVKEPKERVAFDTCWARWLRNAPAPVIEASPSLALPPVPPSPLRWLIVTGGLVAIILSFVVWRGGSSDAPVAALDAGVVAPVDADLAASDPVEQPDAGAADPLAAPTTFPPPEQPPPPSRTALHGAIGALAIGALVLGLAALAGAFGARGRRRFLPGPWRYKVAVPAATRPVLPRVDIEDGAADLTWQASAHGHELDLDRTVAATVASGGLATIVLRRPTAAPRYVVLEDTAGDAERWRFIYDELLRGLAREGVELERYTFTVSPAECFGLDGKLVALRDLFEHADALIVIGDGDAAIDPITGERAEWLAALRHVPHRLWINPVPPARWSAGARAIAVETPMEHGVAHALAALHAGVDRRDRPERAYPAVIDRAATVSAVAALRGFLGVEAFRLVAAVATAGPPTMVAARWLAERLELGPRLDEQAWLYIAALPWFRTHKWTDGLRERLIAALAADAPDLAATVVTVGDSLLASSEPPLASAAHLAWQLDVAGRAAASGDRDTAAAALNRIAGTPLAHEARGRLAALGLPDRARRSLVAAIAVGAVVVGGGAGTFLFARRAERVAFEERAAERHLEKLWGDGLHIPVPSGASWPEAFVARVIDGNGRSIAGARVVWRNPQLGVRAYIGTTDANGLSRATQIYPSPERADLEQVAQLIAVWTGESFTENPVAADGDLVVFRFSQDKGIEPQVAAKVPEPVTAPIDATSANVTKVLEAVRTKNLKVADLLVTSLSESERAAAVGPAMAIVRSWGDDVTASIKRGACNEATTTLQRIDQAQSGVLVELVTDVALMKEFKTLYRAKRTELDGCKALVRAPANGNAAFEAALRSRKMAVNKCYLAATAPLPTRATATATITGGKLTGVDVTGLAVPADSSAPGWEVEHCIKRAVEGTPVGDAPDGPVTAALNFTANTVVQGPPPDAGVPQPDAGIPSDAGIPRGLKLKIFISELVDRSKRVSKTLAAAMKQLIEAAVLKGGYATWPGPLPTAAELTNANTRGVLVTPTVTKLEITPKGDETTIACTVSFKVAPWGGTDVGEQWTSGKTASSNASATVRAGAAETAIALGIRDCLEATLEESLKKQVVPFLQRAGE